MPTSWEEDRLSRSVIAVPPLARTPDGSISLVENERIVGRLQSGGVRTLLYGGNAALYHMSLSEYPEFLAVLTDQADREIVAIPSVGPGFGIMMEQAAILRDFDFPTAMVLPTRDMAQSNGVATGIRKFAESFGKPVVAYLKFEEYLNAKSLRSLVDDGVLSWIKYAVVRGEPEEDQFLSSLIDEIGPKGIVSGIGEQPALAHMRKFKLASFTSGCVCVAPALSMAMLRALKGGDYPKAKGIREDFRPLENLRNAIHPVTVLHEALQLSGIAKTGSLLPLLEAVSEEAHISIKTTSIELMEREEVFAKSTESH